MNAKFNSPQSEGKRAAKNAGDQNAGIICKSKKRVELSLELVMEEFPHRFTSTNKFQPQRGCITVSRPMIQPVPG
jgi:hypothetical protein